MKCRNTIRNSGPSSPNSVPYFSFLSFTFIRKEGRPDLNEMTDLNQLIREAYGGPLCLYKLMSEKLNSNPSFLKRNIHRIKRKKATLFQDINLSIQLDRKESNQLSVFFIAQLRENTQSLFSYQILDAISAVEQSPLEFRCTLKLSKLAIVSRRTNDLQSILVLIVHGNVDNEHDADLYRATCLCKRLSGFSFAGYLTEEVSLKLKSRMCMVDISHLVRDFIPRKKEPSKAYVPSFQSYFFPYLSNSSLKQFELSLQFYCHVFNQNPRDADDIRFSFNVIHDLKNRNKTKFQLVNSSRLLKNGDEDSESNNESNNSNNDQHQLKRTRKSITNSDFISLVPSEENDFYEKTKIIYHFLIHLQGRNKYLEFAQEEYSSLHCVFCGYSCSKNIIFLPNTKKLHRKTSFRLFQLYQHIACCHYHFRTKVFLDTEGILHLYISKLSSVDQSINYFKESGKNLFRNLTCTKLNNSNIFQLLWTSEKPFLSLSQILTDYYHSSTGARLSIEDLNYDSDEDDIDQATFLKFRNNIIDEYADITKHEKEFMKLWNTHITTFPPHGDRLLPFVCQRFLTKYGHVILEKNLRFNLLLHFFTMWDFGLLLSEEIHQYMKYIDSLAS